MSDHRLSLARSLVDAGAGVSARRALGDVRGAPANRLRIAADRASLRPGFFALVAQPDGCGLALPLIPSLGRPRSPDASFREACATALACVRELLDAPSLPTLRFEMEEGLALFGPSIGLGAALAFLGHFLARPPDRAILATGRVLADGRVAGVGHLVAKAEIASAERGARLVLFPPGGEAPSQGAKPVSIHTPEELHTTRVVDTLRDAAALVFGPGPWRVAPGFWSVDDLLRRARTAADPEAGAALLEAVPLPPLLPADRVRVLFDLGTLHRSAGHSRRAFELHDRALSLLDDVRSIVGADIAERCELEHAASALDELEVERVITWLRGRLSEPFLRARNELRCRGMLAQALSISGAFDEALAVREGNLALHERSASLAKSLPMTLCQLTLDAAFAGRSAELDAHAERLFVATPPGDDTQSRYSSAALLRGLVLLGRFSEALDWVAGKPLHGARISPTLAETARGTSPITAQPELTAARALVRAFRETGHFDKAHQVASRAWESRGRLSNLFRWTAALVQLEQALTLCAAGRLSEAEEARSRADEELAFSHPRATAYYGLLDLPLGGALSARLARIWL